MTISTSAIVLTVFVFVILGLVIWGMYRETARLESQVRYWEIQFRDARNGLDCARAASRLQRDEIAELHRRLNERRGMQ